jgi:type IV secretion system protein TrbI
MKSFFSKLFSPSKPPTAQSVGNPVALQKNTTPPPGIQRITNAPTIILILLGSIIACGVVMTAFSKASPLHKPVKAEVENKNQLAETPDWLAQHQTDGVINSQPAKLDSNALIPPSDNTTSDASLAAASPTAQQNSPYEQARFQQWQEAQQERRQAIEERRAILKRSLDADTTVYTHPLSSESADSPLTGSVQKEASPLDKLNAMDPTAPEPENYLMHTRSHPISPYEVKAGTIIPSVMIGGVNSDLPGQIIAQVSHSVFDTATGQYLLIPQGSRLVGAYDHDVVSGQSRVLVVWNRIIYPDASSLTLEGMSGADQAGYAGFHDKTNSHMWPAFRNAILLSAITAGAQLSQPRAMRGDYSYSSPQIASAALGQQMNQLGMQTIARNLNHRPTIVIRPGYVFNVMVSRDIILPPWNINNAG